MGSINPTEWCKYIYGYTGHWGFGILSLLAVFVVGIVWARGVEKWKAENPVTSAVMSLTYTNPEFAFINVYVTNDSPDNSFLVQAKVVKASGRYSRLAVPFSLGWLDHSQASRPIRHGESATARLGDLTLIGEQWRVDFQLIVGNTATAIGDRAVADNFTRELVAVATKHREWIVEVRVIPSSNPPKRYRLAFDAGKWELMEQ